MAFSIANSRTYNEGIKSPGMYKDKVTRSFSIKGYEGEVLK